MADRSNHRVINHYDLNEVILIPKLLIIIGAQFWYDRF